MIRVIDGWMDRWTDVGMNNGWRWTDDMGEPRDRVIAGKRKKLLKKWSICFVFCLL